MPEGDTLHRTAARLRPALVDGSLVRFDAPRLTGPRPRAGERIVAVDAVGKHLLVRFEGGIVLQTHLMMSGSWHLYRIGERWRRPAHQLRVLIEVDGWIAVCFNAPVVRTFLGEEVNTAVGHLGPDLCTDGADVDDVLRRMASYLDPTTTIAEVLLDQRVAAGIGNVYKSEVLFACRVDPFAPLSSIDEPTRRRLVETASAQLRANLGRSSRQTVPGGLAVYGRQRRPCLRCGTPVSMRRHGRQARSTYWCARCQRCESAEAVSEG